MSMVDDTKRPSRSDHSSSRPPQGGSAGGSGSYNDPLAELARLIGQEDPFREMEREARALRQRMSPSIAAANPELDLQLRPSADPVDLDAHQTSGEGEKQSATPDQSRDVTSPMPRTVQRTEQPGWAESSRPTAPQEPDSAYAEAPAYDTEPYYDDQLQDEDYEEAPRRRRGGLATISAVIVLALLGAGGVYAYQAYFTPSGPGQSPIIKAQTEPAKIIPPSAKKSEAPPKIYDRVGDRGQADKLVPREEQPLDMKEVVGTTGTQSLTVPQSGTRSPGAAPATPSQPVAASIEPKKVRTIPIRPDMSIASRPAESANPVAAAAPASDQTASIPASDEAGGYLVQISSQRTDADAQASYRMLQARYPNVLGGRNAIIRRADLGDRGIFYRVQVGPFASAEEAQDMCANLKSAGGQCIIQKN